MRSFLILSISILVTSSCSSIHKKSQLNDIRDLDEILLRAEDNASSEGRLILSTGRNMVEENKVVRGSCWDYANAVYNKAGIKADQRITPLKSKIKGPYADLDSVKAGDWLYFINYSFKEVDHSGIFVEWTDFDKKRGIILSYVGGRKKKAGSYRVYDLKHVYYIIRAK